MKRILLFAPILLILVSCGPSQKEKEEIAIVTCNIMGESRNMDASIRIKEINAARDQIGEAKYLSTDKEIKEAFEYGLCKELVLNDPNYPSKLSELKRLEIEAVRKAEEKAEADRIAKEAKRKEAQKQWRSAIGNHLKEIQSNLSLVKVSRRNTRIGWRLNLEVSCDQKLNGFIGGIRVVLKDNMGTLENTYKPTDCSEYSDKYYYEFTSFDFLGTPDLPEKLESRNTVVEELIEEVHFLIVGVNLLKSVGEKCGYLI